MVSGSGTATGEPAPLWPELPPVKGLQIRTLDDPRVVNRIRILDDYCLTVKYHDHYYDNYVRPCAHHFNQLAFYHDILVGSCTCRIEKTDEEDVYRLYVMTIAVLEPYRRLGVGSHLMRRVLENVSKETKTRIREVALHAQVNSPAIEFYKKLGFTVVERVDNYYVNIDECNALLLSKVVPQPHFEQKTKANVKGAKKKPYIPNGQDRDSYISGIRPGVRYGAFHDVTCRRDNLPDHIFTRIRDEVLFEERARLHEDEERARARVLLLTGRQGKRMAGGSAGDETREVLRMEAIETTNVRHRALLELFSREMEQWRGELAARGLAVEM